MRVLGRLPDAPLDARTLGGMAPLEGSLRERVKSRNRPGAFAGPLAEHLIELDARRGATTGASERARAVASGRGWVVMTGQQPALWGGPLYSLYKLASAIAAARWLEETTGHPVLPVFWIVGDDADFGEVASVWLPSAEGRVVKIRDENPPPGGTRVGTLAASRQLTLFLEHRDVWERHPRGPELAVELEGALRASATWADAQSAIFHRIFPGAPFLAVDGGERSLLEASQGFLREARSRLIPDLLAEGAGEALALGLDPAFDPELARRALFRLEGDRRELADEDAGPPAVLAPNVVLRPPLQDWMFPNVVTVCGPSEIRYRAQLGPVYRTLGIDEPLRLPRLQAHLLPRVPADPAEALEGYAKILEDPAGYVDERVRAALPRGLIEDLQSLRDQVREQMGRLTEQAKDLDASLEQLFGSAAGKADYQLDRLVEGVRAKTRHRLLQAEPLLGSLEDFVRPRGREQERVLSLWAFVFGTEEAANALLVEAAHHFRTLVVAERPRPERVVWLQNRRNAHPERPWERNQ